MLGSLNTIRKNLAIVPMFLGRPSPDPGPGVPGELGGSHTGELLDLLWIGKTLPDQRIAAEEASPTIIR
jgi:hypothetical protein